MSLAEKQAETKRLAVAVASKIYHYKWIAASVGISEKTMHEWKNNDPEFESQLDQARAEFINSNMRKARPDFLLETADRELFGNKQKVELETGKSLTSILLEKYGVIEGGDNDRKDDGAVSAAPTSKT